MNWERRLADNAGNALDDPKDRSKAQQAASERLDAMRGYCESDSCLRGVILDYFGDDHDEYCDNCGNCTYIADCDQPSSTGGKTKKTKPKTSTQGLDLAEIDATIAGFVYDRERMLGFGYGIRKTIRSLMGDTGEGVDDRDIDQLDGYGALSDLDEDVIEDRIHKLIDDGTIYVAATTRYWSHNAKQNNKTGRTEKGKGLSQIELSHATGIKQSRISEFETGRIPTANMTLKTAVTLAEALGVHAEDLLD